MGILVGPASDSTVSEPEILDEKTGTELPNRTSTAPTPPAKTITEPPERSGYVGTQMWWWWVAVPDPQFILSPVPVDSTFQFVEAEYMKGDIVCQ